MKIKRFNESNMENKLPTSKELIFSILSDVKCDNEIEYLKTTKDGQEILGYMVEEVQNHIDAYRKDIIEKIKHNVSLTDFAQEFMQEGASEAIDMSSIENAYPKNLIK
jgi:CHASE3 domain sensor protein